MDFKGESDSKVLLAFENPKDNELIEIKTPRNPLPLKETQKKINIFFRFPQSILHKGNKKSVVTFTDEKSGKILLKKEINFVGPIK